MNKFILSTSILAALTLTSVASLPVSVPELPHAGPGWNIDANGAVDFATRDINRLVGNIMLTIARRSPYVGILDGGTIDNSSEATRSVVAEKPILGHSMVEPEFVDDIEQCGNSGPSAQVGSTEFEEKLQTIRGKGPKVCVKTTRTAFKGSYSAAETGIKQQLVQLNNADVRINLVRRSGCKLVVRTGKTFHQMFAGEVNAINTPFPTADTGVPDAAINFKVLKRAMNFMREDLQVTPFEGTQDDGNFKAMGSHDIIEKFRDELGIKEDMRSLAQGGFRMGEKFITGYSWEGPYRGIMFGVDPQPLRFNDLDEDGQPIFLEPEYAANVTNGVGARIRPQWARAKYEVLLLAGAGSFKRRTPAAYNGEGNWKWPTQLVNGELEFVVIRDNDKNIFGDFGYFIYQIQRSFKPERPHHIMAIAYKRCDEDFDLVTCDDYAGFSSSESL